MRFAYLVAGACLAAATPAVAQQPPSVQTTPESGADQVVGLFSATCLHFASDVTGLRGFLNEQHAPQMPAAAQQAFLAGRRGQVFDVSYQVIKLALVSLDDGGCEAVAERADGNQVIALLNQASRENQVPLTALGNAGGAKGKPGVTQTAFSLTLAGQPMHILVSTEGPAPQAVLTLVPK